MVLQEYSKYSASPKIESIHELVRLVGPDILQIYRLILHDVGLKGIGKQDLNGFKNLVHLNLSGNNIVRIEGLNHLGSTLQTLDLSCNRITKIPPDCFKDLVHLRKLNLAFNSISSLEAMSQMHGSNYQLQVLDLRNNDIKDPKNILFLKGLVNLKVLLFQNADRTAQNPVCSNFHKDERTQHKSWRAFVKYQLPLLENLDQIALYSEGERGVTFEEEGRRNNHDLANDYPELNKLLEEYGSEDDDNNDSIDRGIDEELNQLEKMSPNQMAWERHRLPMDFGKNSGLPSHTYWRSDMAESDSNPATSSGVHLSQKDAGRAHSNQEKSSTRIFTNVPEYDIRSLELSDMEESAQPVESTKRHVRENNPPPPSIKSESPVSARRKGTEQYALQKSTVFNNQFKKLGNFIHKHKRRHETQSSDGDDKENLRRSDEDSNEEDDNVEFTSPPKRQRQRDHMRKKRRAEESDLDISDVQTEVSYPSFPHVNENLRSLPSVLSFSSPRQEIEPLPNEEKEKLIAMIAELSETLGNTNAFIQQRETELAAEVTRRRKLEEKTNELQGKVKDHKEKNKTLAKIVRELKSQLGNQHSYQYQLESTVKKSEDEVSSLQKEIERLKGRVTELEQENFRYSVAVSQSDSTSEELKVLLEKLQSSEISKQNLLTQNNTLLQEQESLQKEIMALKYKLRKQEEQHKRSLQQQTKLVSKQLVMKDDDLVQEVERLKSQHSIEISELVESHEKKVSHLQESFQKQLEELREENRRQVESLEKSHKTEMDQLQSSHSQEAEKLQGTLQSLHENEIRPRDSKIEALESNHATLKAELEEIQSENKALLDKNVELKNYLKKYVNQEIHARATEDSLKEIIQNQASKLKGLAGKLKQHQADSKKRETTLITEAETWQHKYEADICALQSKMKMMQINLTTKDKIIEKLEKKINSSSNFSEEAEKEYKQKLEEQAKAMEKLELEVQRLLNECTIKQHIIDDRDETIQGQKSELQSLREENKKILRDISYYEDKIDGLKDEQAASDDQLEKKAKVIEDLQLELEETSHLLTKQAQKYQKLKQIYESTQTDIASLKSSNEELSGQKSRLENSITQVKLSLQEKETHLNQMEESLRAQQQEIAHYKQEIVNQKAQMKFLVDRVKSDNEEKEVLKKKLKRLRMAFEDE